jgi:hypothetical protein
LRPPVAFAIAVKSGVIVLAAICDEYRDEGDDAGASNLRGRGEL